MTESDNGVFHNFHRIQSRSTSPFTSGESETLLRCDSSNQASCGFVPNWRSQRRLDIALCVRSVEKVAPIGYTPLWIVSIAPLLQLISTPVTRILVREGKCWRVCGCKWRHKLTDTLFRPKHERYTFVRNCLVYYRDRIPLRADTVSCAPPLHLLWLI